MSTIINGNPANVTTQLSATIVGCANNGSGLIRVHTSSAHLFGPGDFVLISGVVGTIEANGTWLITVIDSTHFDLTFSSFLNAYASGGLALDLSLTPQIQWPSDGDPTSAQLSGLLSGATMLASWCQYLNTLFLLGNVVAQVTSSSTVIVPGVAAYALILASGGGGGGGGGYPGLTTTGTMAMGGSGGAGGLLVQRLVPIQPQTGLTVVVGAGGAGGAAGNPGSNGSASTVTVPGYGVVSVPGGRGGFAASNSLSAASSGSDLYVPGASGPGETANVAKYGSWSATPAAPTPFQLPTDPGSGGSTYGSVNATPTYPYAFSGVGNMGFPGGQGGSNGTATSSYYGGGGGGGGGGGPLGGSGSNNGGTGGLSGGTGTGGAGNVGQPGGANSGEGGGGGSGGGAGQSGGGAGGAGGAGGSGQVVIMFFQSQAQAR